MGEVEQPDVGVAIPDPENEADIHLSARTDNGQAPSAEQVQRCLNRTQFLLIKVQPLVLFVRDIGQSKLCLNLTLFAHRSRNQAHPNQLYACCRRFKCILLSEQK